MKNPTELPPALRRSARVIRMVHELHKLGYQRLRVMPYLGPANGWHLDILPASRILVTHGAWGDDREPRACYRELDGNEYFSWPDAQHHTAADLAAKFIDRFPDLCRAGWGRDWAYAGWYLELMRYADGGELPCAGANGMPPADPRFLPTIRFLDSGLPMPPGGELYPRWVRPPEVKPLDPDAPSRTIPFSRSRLPDEFKLVE